LVEARRVRVCGRALTSEKIQLPAVRTDE
jgi:hypothetical protein